MTLRTKVRIVVGLVLALMLGSIFINPAIVLFAIMACMIFIMGWAVSDIISDSIEND